MLSIIVAIWGLENIALSAIALGKIRKNHHTLEFIYRFASINGAFVWEDMVVFGLFHALGSAAGFVFGDLRISVLLFILFWCVRSTGEILYYFLQQFIRPKHHPHNISAHFRPLQRLFGTISDQKSFIIMQVFLQTVLVVSLCALTLLLLQWNAIGVLTP